MFRILASGIFAAAILVIAIQFLLSAVFRRLSLFSGSSEPIRIFSLPIALAAVFLAVSAAAAVYLSVKFRKLTAAIARVSGGDFSCRISFRKGEVFSDVYERFNLMAQDLEQKRTLRDDFISGFSHEFKTPVSSIKGFAELLLEGGCTDSERREYLSIIAEEAGRLASLSDRTLLFSRLQKEQILEGKTRFDLGEQVRRCVIMFHGACEAKGIFVEVDAPECRILGNEMLLKEVWINLLSNAVKFTDSGERITVRLCADGGGARVVVADTGRGIHSEALPYIFEQYFQGERSHALSGNGLGLAIARRIVKLHGGSIFAESRAGEGSRFTVSLPLSDVPTA